MKKLAEYLICILFGVIVGFFPYYYSTKDLLDRPTVVNEFRKIKTKKDAQTTVDVSTVVEKEDKKKKWNLFRRGK